LSQRERWTLQCGLLRLKATDVSELKSKAHLTMTIGKWKIEVGAEVMRAMAGAARTPENPAPMTAD
jgi:hypothetical protein